MPSLDNSTLIIKADEPHQVFQPEKGLQTLTKRLD
jgi:hypothetical protein